MTAATRPDQQDEQQEIGVPGECFVLWGYATTDGGNITNWMLAAKCDSTVQAAECIAAVRRDYGKKSKIEVRVVRKMITNYAFEQFDGLSVEDLVRALDEWQKRKDALDAELKAINKVFDFLRITRIPAEFEEKGVDNLKLAGIGRCSLTADMHVSIAAERKPEALQWFDDTGRGGLVRRDVNPSTLKAIVKECTLKGEQLPPGVFNVNPYTRASITRTKS